MAFVNWKIRRMGSDCFVEAEEPERKMPYHLEVLGDDYTGYGESEGKLAHCQMIVRWAMGLGFFRHKKSKGLYKLVGPALVQADQPLTDMTEVQVYEGEDGRLWVRPTAEFKERFTKEPK